MKRSGDSTHHCGNPTPTLNGCDVTPSTEKQSSEQESSYLLASKRHPSTPYSKKHPSKLFTWRPAVYLPQVDKTCVGYQSLACFQDFSKICWRVEICSVFLRPRPKLHWVSSSFGSIVFCGILHSSWKARQRDSAVIDSLTPISNFGDDQFANL